MFEFSLNTLNVTGQWYASTYIPHRNQQRVTVSWYAVTHAHAYHLCSYGSWVSRVILGPLAIQQIKKTERTVPFKCSMHTHTHTHTHSTCPDTGLWPYFLRYGMMFKRSKTAPSGVQTGCSNGCNDKLSDRVNEVSCDFKHTQYKSVVSFRATSVVGYKQNWP